MNVIDVGRYRTECLNASSDHLLLFRVELLARNLRVFVLIHEEGVLAFLLAVVHRVENLPSRFLKLGDSFHRALRSG